MHPGVWHMRSDISHGDQTHAVPSTHASPGRGLNNNYCRLSQALANKQNWHAGPPSDFNRPTSVSVPYSSPMFDVQDVSRFYRCSISDVHIGRSLVSMPLQIVKRSRSEFPCNWRYINVKTRPTFIKSVTEVTHLCSGSHCLSGTDYRLN